MIYDNIENARLYTGLSANIAKALNLLKDKSVLSKPPGRYEVDGDSVFYIVQNYTTKPIAEGRLETHKKYIDIQFVISGSELIGCINAAGLEVDTPYAPAGDIAFYKTVADMTPLHLTGGTFAVFFPHEAHMPGRVLSTPAEIRKIVVKIKTTG